VAVLGVFLFVGMGPQSASAAAGSSYTVVPVQGPAGSCIVRTSAVNDLGDAVGYAQFPGGKPQTSNVRAFYWHAESLLELADGDPGAGVFGNGSCSDNPVDAAYDLNALGSIVGQANFKDPNPGSSIPDRFAALWSPGASAPTSLGVLNSACYSSGQGSAAGAINAAGDITGWSTFCTSNNQQSFAPFFLPHGGVLGTSGQPIPSGGGAGFGPHALLQGVAINASDQIVLNTPTNNSGVPLESDLWSRADNSIKKLPFLVGFSSSVLNDSGVVVGSDNNLPVYSVGAGPEQQLKPAGGLPNGVAAGVNSKGDVVGFSSGGGHVIATLWPASVPPASGTPPAPVDLQTLLPPGSPQLVSGVAISSNGTILATTNTGYVVLKPGGGIGGTVTDDVGDAPLADGGVTVMATGSNGQVTTSTTDGNGQYRLWRPVLTPSRRRGIPSCRLPGRSR
jgi:hypothetical protein